MSLTLFKKNSIKFKNVRFNRLTRKQRLLKKNKYLKRRLIRLTKRSNWLKRKHKKRLKLIRKHRRVSLCFTLNKLIVVSKIKKISSFLFKNRFFMYKSILKPNLYNVDLKMFNTKNHTKKLLPKIKLNSCQYNYN